MKRRLLDKLLQWKHQPMRKPLLIDGARQTGKTYLLHVLLEQTFSNCVRIDFLENRDFKQAFEGSLEPAEIIFNLELITNQKFDIATDLLILDEIGECERALHALKYFAEKAPQCYVAASGSNIGLLNTFPVGTVEHYELRPLTFVEFIEASNESAVVQAYNEQKNTAVAHQKLHDAYLDYLYVGGMPEAVACWYDNNLPSVLSRIEKIKLIHKNLLNGYLLDFGKYSGIINTILIASVFTSIPSQLAAVRDGSVNRFRFKDVMARKSCYSDFDSAINYLRRYKLVLANHPIEGMPRIPLATYVKDNRIKLFLFDTGLLNHVLPSM